jgi:phytanoyl-CoA hydroxylase
MPTEDWAFYPHTNDDILAVGLAIDDTTVANGATQFIPRSHMGPVLDHHLPRHLGGHFCGGVTEPAFGAAGAVTVPVRAGGISLHHGRTLHGSPSNGSSQPRRIMFIQYTALDAFPLVGIANHENFWGDDVLLGQPTIVPRIRAAPVRMPFPPAPRKRNGSIYASQTLLEKPLFETSLPRDELIEAEFTHSAAGAKL